MTEYKSTTILAQEAGSKKKKKKLKLKAAKSNEAGLVLLHFNKYNRLDTIDKNQLHHNE